MSSLVIHERIKSALERGQPVVVLESAVMTHGLPREPAESLSLNQRSLPIDSQSPINLQTVLSMQQAVRDAARGDSSAGGATPAVVAVTNGKLRLGLEDDELRALAADADAVKAAAPNLAHILATGCNAGTTVSATLIACQLARSAIRNQNPATVPLVFATGGIGGIHRDWHKSLDVSADLKAISQTPIAIVCSGAKSLLDVRATLQALESLCVPVLGYRTNVLPQFIAGSHGNDARELSIQRIDNVCTAARICDVHWNGLKQSSAVIIAKPVDEELALDSAELQRLTEQAERAAVDGGHFGSRRTPFVLAEVARLTHGRSLAANVSLLVENARLAAELAIEISRADKGVA